MSQNCVRRSCPPGELRQQDDVVLGELWQDNWGLSQTVGVPAITEESMAT